MLFSNLLLLLGVAVSNVAARSIREFLHRKIAFSLVELNYSSSVAFWIVFGALARSKLAAIADQNL